MECVNRIDFMNKVNVYKSAYNSIIWYLKEWLNNSSLPHKISVWEVDDVKYVFFRREEGNVCYSEIIQMYERNGYFFFNLEAYWKNKDDAEWLDLEDENIFAFFPVKSVGRCSFAKFIKEYYETYNKAQVMIYEQNNFYVYDLSYANWHRRTF